MFYLIIKVGNGEKDIYTINFAMQQKDKKYDILERVLCYAMSILSNILQIEDNYAKLHKVYSIWFLNFNYFALMMTLLFIPLLPEFTTTAKVTL